MKRPSRVPRAVEEVCLTWASLHRQGHPGSIGRARRQAGQALIWLLGTLATSAAVLYGVYNVGQLTVGKQKAVNAADAAALAGANVQARLLNLIAYNNRSRMANEALLVQMMSIESWLAHMKHTTENASIVTAWIPGVGSILNRISQAVDRVGDGVADGVDGLIAGLKLQSTMFFVEHQVLAQGGGLLAEDAASKVVAASKTNFGGRSDAGLQMDNRTAVKAYTFVRNNAEWINFTQLYTGYQRGDAKQVLLDSRDGFSTVRNGNGLLNFNLFVAGGEKLGGSTLQGFDRWEAQDTYELWVRTLKGKDYAPVGWGRSNARANGGAGNTWRPGRTAQRLAWSEGLNPPHLHNGWGGVPSVYDLRRRDTAKAAEWGVDLMVVVDRLEAATMTTNQIGMVRTPSDSPLGSADMHERLAAGRLSAISKARVSFMRPGRSEVSAVSSGLGDMVRTDGLKEYGSLYSPYWQARLVDTSAAEKAAVMLAMGLTPDHAVYTPGGQKKH